MATVFSLKRQNVNNALPGRDVNIWPQNSCFSLGYVAHLGKIKQLPGTYCLLDHFIDLMAINNILLTLLMLYCVVLCYVVYISLFICTFRLLYSISFYVSPTFPSPFLPSYHLLFFPYSLETFSKSNIKYIEF